MAYSLCSSPSYLHHPLCNSLSSCSSSSRDQTTKPLKPHYSLKLSTSLLPSHSRPCLHITHVSLQDNQTTIPPKPTSKNPKFTDPNNKDPKFRHPDSKTSKSYIWVNPKSAKASQLRQKSYDSRYASLVMVAESLNSCEPSEVAVSDVLDGSFSGVGGGGYGESKFFEQDAVVVINYMSNPETALLAMKYFLERVKFTREVILYNVTLKVFRKSRDLRKAEHLFEQMLKNEVKPDNVTFSTIISCARLANLPNKAVEWFEKMPSFGVKPDDVTYSTMIDSYGKAGNVEMALSLYDCARTEKWRLDTVTFSTLIKIYGVSGNFDGCLNVYEEMKALGAKPNLVTYNTLLDAMGRARRPWQAKKIYRDMIGNGFSPSFATYASLIRAYGRARYGEDAMIVYNETKEKGLELNVILYNTLLAMCADLGFVDEAIEIFEDMKNSGTKPDSWTYSSMITIFSCSGKVSDAETLLNEMIESGFDPNIFVLTSLIQCYGKAQRADDVVRTFNQLLELGINPDERFCGCLLNVMTQTPKEELGKIVECVEKANSKVGRVVKLLLDEQESHENFKNEAYDLFLSIGADVKKAFCNCLIDICVNLDLLEKACELLELGLTHEIYTDIQSRSSTQWSLQLKSLSLGAALTALHVWINDLTKALESGDELPPLLGINTGHGKHKYSDKGLASVFESHLRELNAPFHEAPDKVGWFLTTKVAAESWLQSRKSAEDVVA